MDSRKQNISKNEVPPSASIINEDDKNISSPEEQPSKVKKYDVVIVGAGLGGLTTAVEATKAGKSVLIIECRQEQYVAIRPQLIFLFNQTVSYLKSLRPDELIEPSDINLLKRLAGLEHCSIKDIQRYLLRRIDWNYCTIRYESEVSSVNLDEGI